MKMEEMELSLLLNDMVCVCVRQRDFNVVESGTKAKKGLSMLNRGSRKPVFDCDKTL